MALWDNNQLKLVMHLANPLVDSSANGYNLAKGSGVPTSVTGHGGTASDAVNAVPNTYWTITDSSAPNLRFSTAMTLSFWINPQTIAASTFYNILGKWGASGAYSYSVGLNATGTGQGKLQFYISSNGTAYTVLNSNIILTTSTWYHVVMIYDGSYMSIYVNGSLDAQVAYSSGINNSTSNFTVAANSVPTYYIASYLDDLAAWSRALSASEVSSLYFLGDDFATTPSVNGVIRDINGTIINCSTYPVRINAYPVNNSTNAPTSTFLCTDSGGVWQVGSLVASTKYLVTFEMDNYYDTLNESNIAGAEFMTAA